MQITTSTTKLKAVLQRVTWFTKPRSTLPILGGILIAATDKITLTATTLDQSAVFDLPGQIAEQGSFVINNRRFRDWITSLTEQTITISLESGVMVCKLWDGTTAMFPAIDPAEFPEIKKASTFTDKVTVNGAKLKDALRRALPQASTYDSRPLLCSVKLDVIGEKITAAACDGFTVFAVTKDAVTSEEKHDPFNLLIPSDTVKMLLRLLLDTDVTLCVKPDDVVFCWEGVEVWSMQTEKIEKYPDYKVILPRSNKHQARMQKSILAPVIQQAIIFVKGNNEAVRLRFEDGKVTVYTEEMDECSFSRALPLPDFTGNITIAFNAYLLARMLNVTGEALDIRFNNEKSPVTFCGNCDDDYTAVIMPMYLG